ncbi:response regulator transcription factor [Legionella israelensis]|uniref:Response regulator n=1 Tax=Legionella israelensis TaxID=454 RepID=A0A0W0VP17_9GAMM|nr:response regulator transcription factor [Legionella israelensis]KTD21481.1 response regulator [Legionella israelensis]QBS10049.1 response regulator transcription factor [Legionella israelensis]SCX78781.1 DNA-binding response regulator, OmpR family, contains REC and winged-helix (wHTH) domain [Legionella israelensis DSM 19235]STX59633.1 response regulator [Legionella israelensis]
MEENDYLLFFDKDPVDPELEDYFKNFNINIVQKSNLTAVQPMATLPTAILISWSLLKEQPDMLQTIYQSFQTPLIVIQEHRDEQSCVNLLEKGADDVLVKPLLPRELHARINAIHRRVTGMQSQMAEDKEVLKFANWRLYPSSRQVFDENHEELTLSAGEYDLLYAFIQQPHQVLTREFLSQITKHSDLGPLDRRIDVQISRLRHKIEPQAKKPGLIKTIRNEGYLFTANVLVLKESEL